MMTFYSYKIVGDTYYPYIYIENVYMSGLGWCMIKNGNLSMILDTGNEPPECGETRYLYQPMTVDENEDDEVILEKLLKQDFFDLIKSPVISKFSVRQKIHGIYEGLTSSGWTSLPFDDEFQNEAINTSNGFIIVTDEEKAKPFVQNGKTAVKNPPYLRGFVYQLNDGKVAIYIMW